MDTYNNLVCLFWGHVLGILFLRWAGQLATLDTTRGSIRGKVGSQQTAFQTAS